MKHKSLRSALAIAGLSCLAGVNAATIDIVGAGAFSYDANAATPTQFDIDIVANNLLEGLNTAGDLSFYTQGGGIIINYDPSVLSVNTTSFDQFGSNQFATAIWDFVKEFTVDNVNGQIDLFVSRIGTSFTMPASQLLGSVRFDVVGAGNTLLDISTQLDPNIGGFAYTADAVPPPATGTQTTISTYYCVDGIQTYDANGVPSCGHGAADGEPSIYFNDALVSVNDVTVVPVPAAVWLFGSGLIGLVGIARRKTDC